MEKHELLEQVTNFSAQRQVTLKELVSAYNLGKSSLESDIAKGNMLAKILYYLGGAIIFLGIAVLISRHWNNLGFPIRLFASFGIGIAAYVVGVLLQSNRQLSTVAQSCFFLAMLVLPVGFYVYFDHLGLNINNAGVQSIIAGTLFVFFIISYWLYREDIFIIFNFIFGTWFVFSFTNYLIAGDPYFLDINFFKYRTLLTGIVYILFGYHYSLHDKDSLAGLLYSLGALAFLASVLDLSGWKPNQNLFWENSIPIFCFLFIFLSIPLKSKALLSYGVIFLTIYIGKLTFEYFSDNLTWPIALMVIGISMIALGFAGFQIYKNYLAHENYRLHDH